jgi:hypothetical protein
LEAPLSALFGCCDGTCLDLSDEDSKCDDSSSGDIQSKSLNICCSGACSGSEINKIQQLIKENYMEMGFTLF